mmetsp:Transcript_49166/g.151826  ORF Transcript_49166/g.151826 Transcript_49166/m.151826 type:complete len:226 (-) Transcript_49166:4-681(-)
MPVEAGHSHARKHRPILDDVRHPAFRGKQPVGIHREVEYPRRVAAAGGERVAEVLLAAVGIWDGHVELYVRQRRVEVSVHRLRGIGESLLALGAPELRNGPPVRGVRWPAHVAPEAPVVPNQEHTVEERVLGVRRAGWLEPDKAPEFRGVEAEVVVVIAPGERPRVHVHHRHVPDVPADGRAWKERAGQTTRFVGDETRRTKAGRDQTHEHKRHPHATGNQVYSQ